MRPRGPGNEDGSHLKDSATFTSYGKLFHTTAPLYLKHLLPESVFGLGRDKSVSLFLRS